MQRERREVRLKEQPESNLPRRAHAGRAELHEAIGKGKREQESEKHLDAQPGRPELLQEIAKISINALGTHGLVLAPGIRRGVSRVAIDHIGHLFNHIPGQALRT